MSNTVWDQVSTTIINKDGEKEHVIIINENKAK
jgi:hypothetical protein